MISDSLVKLVTLVFYNEKLVRKRCGSTHNQLFSANYEEQFFLMFIANRKGQIRSSRAG